MRKFFIYTLILIILGLGVCCRIDLSKTASAEEVKVAPVQQHIIPRAAAEVKALSLIQDEPIYREAEPLDYDTYYIPWADISISVDDFKLMCRAVYCESGNQTLEAQRLVAIVILNRILSEDFPNNMHDVIYQGGGTQFNVVRRSDFNYVDFRQGKDLTETACFLAIAQCSEEPSNLLYFRSGHYHNGSRYKNYTQDGDMFFSLGVKP